MTYQSNTSRSKKYIIAIVLAVVLSIILGFALDGMITLAERAIYKKPKEYAQYVEKYSEKYDVPEHIIYAVMKAESGFDENATSSAGAMGLMQMLPSTFDYLSRDHFGEVNEASELYNAETSIKYGTYYLHDLYKKFGDWSVVFAAYNAGEGTVKNDWLTNSEYSSDGKTLDNIPYRETRKYVSKVERYVKKYNRIYKND